MKSIQKNSKQNLISSLVIVAIVTACLGTAIAGGHSCKKCGHDKQVKPCLRLVKVCQEVELPEYAYLKQEVFLPDKGWLCYTGYRCDTYYRLWRECECNSKGKGELPLIQDPLQTSPKKPLPPLSCQCYTKSGCVTLFGAMPTGYHTGCVIRQQVAAPKILVPVMKWETVYLCKSCGKH